MTREEALMRLQGVLIVLTPPKDEQKILSLGELYSAVREVVEIYIADLNADED